MTDKLSAAHLKGRDETEKLSVRFALSSDWAQIGAVWRQNHENFEAANAITRLLVGAFPVILVAAAYAHQRSMTTDKTMVTGWSLLGGYCCLVSGQHLIHLLCIKLMVWYDLRWGDLTEDAWARHAMLDGYTRKPKAAVLVAVDEVHVRIIGVMCVQFGRSAFGQLHTSEEKGNLPASLWNVAVDSLFRDKGVTEVLLHFAELWAQDSGADRLEVLCLSKRDKQICCKQGFTSSMSWFSSLAIVPAYFFKSLTKLDPHVCRTLRNQVYLCFLEALVDWKFIERLNDDTSVLRVSLPFCGECLEAPLLAEFLVKQFADRGSVEEHKLGIAIAACDVRESFSWHEVDKSMEKFGSRVQLTFKQQDLSAASLPGADLTLGIHPGPFGEGHEGQWNQIIANVLKGCGPNSCCVFATCSLGEVLQVQQICNDLGNECDIRENPYYKNFPSGYSPVFVRFIAMVNVDKRSVRVPSGDNS